MPRKVLKVVLVLRTRADWLDEDIDGSEDLRLSPCFENVWEVSSSCKSPVASDDMARRTYAIDVNA